MAIEYRPSTDTGAVKAQDIYEDGVYVETRYLPPAAQNAKVRLEERMERMFLRWQRWKLTRQEAVTQGYPAAVVTALADAEEAAFANYMGVINQWRKA